MGKIDSANFDESYYSKKYLNHSKGEVYLKQQLENVKDKQGFLGNIWNGFKEVTTLGTSASDCESMLEKYNSGEITFEQAAEYINSFEIKQENMKGLLSNILTGVGSIAAAVAMYSNPATITATMAIKAGAPVGAILKTGINLLDRATNNIEGDELDAKTIAKDAISGAVTGATSAVSSGVGKGIKSSDFGLTVRNGIKCGMACGAASGAASYLTDTIFDEDKYFDFDEMINQAAFSSFVSGTVGGIVGSGMYGISELAGNVGKNISKNAAQTIISDSTSSSARKILGQVERNIITA